MMLSQSPTDIDSRTASFLMPKPQPTLQFNYPLPYGAMVRDGGVQFAIYSHSATAMRVLLYRRVTDAEPHRVIEFNPLTDRWGDIWSIFVPELPIGTLYHFQADGPFAPEEGYRFDGRRG